MPADRRVWLLGSCLLVSSMLGYGLNAQNEVIPLHTIQQPYAGARVIEGYHIGDYPPASNTASGIYARPNRIIRVTETNQRLQISDHFRLGQFLCKQESDWPKYLVLDEKLLTLLDAIVDLLQREGVAVESLHVMSGYRTPAYNAALGNVPLSRHIYGDAADIFVDIDGDQYMDDLNGDGKSDVDDARWLYELIERHQQDLFAPLQGGMSVYGPNEYHGPFVHLDTRGTRARWGAMRGSTANHKPHV